MIKASSTNNRNREAILDKCPVTFTLQKIGGRWKPLILWQLKDERLRYSELRRALPLISEKMLIQQLKELEQDGLVIREARAVVPPFVEYRLTTDGQQIREVLSAMARWGMQMQEKEKTEASR
jgi:DNA-binding HxlR family transcriptional regulator